MPDLPTIAEFVPGYEGIGWQGVAAPRNTPTEIIERLSREINAGLDDPRIKARIADLGATVFRSSPVEFGAFIAAYTEKWAGDPGGQHQARIRRGRNVDIPYLPIRESRFARDSQHPRANEPFALRQLTVTIRR
jgi:Tripartite tricarboxylate transporter family receptor